MIDREHLQTATNILNNYLSAHDALFKFSIRRLLPIPKFFQRIDYAGIYCALSDDFGRLLELIEEVKLLELDSRDNMVFFNYLVALDLAVEKLLHILAKLHIKSEGDSEAYTFNKYNSDCDEYHLLVKEYSAIGAELNNLVVL